MTQKTIAWSALTLLVVGGIALFLLKAKKQKPPFAPTNACMMGPAVCPQMPYDVDAYGCPNAANHPEMGGYNSTTKVCTVTFAYYKQFGGCNSEHEPPMIFYSKPDTGQASRFHLVAVPNVTTIRAEFTEIKCDTHATIGNPGLAQPFVDDGDDFSAFKPEHTSGNADHAMVNKCFKVVVENRPGCSIDPHLSIGN